MDGWMDGWMECAAHSVAARSIRCEYSEYRDAVGCSGRRRGRDLGADHVGRIVPAVGRGGYGAYK
jgi:hypothetical protein